MSLHFSPFSPFRPFPVRAREVRSGEVIATRLSPRLDTLRVTAVHHERFTNPEGRTLDVVRYDGERLFDGEPTGKFVTRAWGQVADDRVTVVGDTNSRRMRERFVEALAVERVYNLAVRG